MRRIALALGLLALALAAGSVLHHTLRLAQEEAAHPAPGRLVDVNGHAMHLYAVGRGAPTLVFLAGSGTSAPVLDFKALASRLARDYRVVVVERAGYGWSEITPSPRDIGTVLAESRLALQEAGEQPPYVLFAHSMAGLEALYWATLYPGEVVAVIGLDAAVPSVYEAFPLPSRPVLALATLAARSGLTRLVPSLCRDSAAIRERHLTEAEAATACALFYRRTLTSNMLAEIGQVQANARSVAARGRPAVPLLFFISNGEGLPVADWETQVVAYLAGAGEARYIVLDVGHAVHNLAPDVIHAESDAFIQAVLAEP